MAAVIYTAPQGERKAKARIERFGYRTFLSLGRTKRRPEPRPLFPRYLFAWIDGPWRQVKASGWITDILRQGDRLADINEDDIADIRRRMMAGGGSILIEEPESIRHELRLGEPIKITSGPYADLEGLYQSSSNGRITCLVSLFNRTTEISIPQSYVA